MVFYRSVDVQEKTFNNIAGNRQTQSNSHSTREGKSHTLDEYLSNTEVYIPHLHTLSTLHTHSQIHTWCIVMKECQTQTSASGTI